MKYSMKEVEIDNRDENTTELVLPNGDRLEVTRKELKDLIDNMDENTADK